VSGLVRKVKTLSKEKRRVVKWKTETERKVRNMSSRWQRSRMSNLSGCGLLIF
jgi:anti-sigma-K factor RskA